MTVKILCIQKFEAFVEWKYLNTSKYYGDFIQTPEDNPSFRILAKKRLFAKFEQISKNTAIIILISMRRWQCHSQRYPLKLCLIKDELDFHIFILKTIYFDLWLLCKNDLRISCLYKKEWKNYQDSGLNNFRIRKTTLSSTFLIRLRFQEYCCKSSIAICA